MTCPAEYPGGEITFSFPNFNDVWAWMNDVMAHFIIGVITNPCLLEPPLPSYLQYPIKPVPAFCCWLHWDNRMVNFMPVTSP